MGGDIISAAVAAVGLEDDLGGVLEGIGVVRLSQRSGWSGRGCSGTSARVRSSAVAVAGMGFSFS